MNDISSFGGMETMIVQEVKYLISKGYQVTVLCPPPCRSIRIAPSDSLSIFHFPKSILPFPWLMRDSLVVLWIWLRVRALSKESSLCAFSFSVIDGMGPSLAKLLGSDVKVVLRIVGPLSYEVVHFTLEKKLRYRLYSYIFRIVELMAYLVSDLILPVSEFEESSIKAYGIDDSKIRLVRCGIDSSRFSGDRTSRSLGLPSGTRVVMFIGRFVEKNGPLVLAEAVDSVLSSVPDCAFIFVGDGPLRPLIESMLSAQITEGKVILTGFRDDIPELHSQAHVYAGHVSSKVEGLGQTVFEAMMSGLPVVVGRDRISARLVCNGVDGVLVDKDDPTALAGAITSLLQSEETRRLMGTAARNKALQLLSFESMMQQILAETQDK
jgi:glycosyltransferase involved in cell wall biosynthesis